uniref:Uncharacterized protein n=1 Tax=Salix viminalis TaxID=40686 RepID=A0A6N2KDJ0_SALVM
MCGCFDYGREGVAVWWGLVGKHESEEVKRFLVLSEIEEGMDLFDLVLVFDEKLEKVEEKFRVAWHYSKLWVSKCLN